MKKNIMMFLKSVILLIVVMSAFFYYVNYRAEGTTAYITQVCPVYNSPEHSNQIDTLSVGDNVSVLVYHGDSNKIRYINEAGDTVVGFVSDQVLGYYAFPVNTNREIILTVSSRTNFNDFISTLVDLDDQDFSLIGVYEDFSLSSSNSRGDLYKIQDFCEEQRIPWGVVSDLNQNSYDDYIADKVAVEFERPVYKYKVLPYAFHIYNEDYISSSYELENCVIYTSSGKARPGFDSWLTNLSSSASQPRNSEILNKESIYAYKFYEDSEIDFSFISDDWSYDIGLAYKEIEDATRD